MKALIFRVTSKQIKIPVDISKALDYEIRFQNSDF